jgi:hypothetical protein
MDVQAQLQRVEKDMRKLEKRLKGLQALPLETPDRAGLILELQNQKASLLQQETTLLGLLFNNQAQGARGATLFLTGYAVPWLCVYLSQVEKDSCLKCLLVPSLMLAGTKALNAASKAKTIGLFVPAWVGDDVEHHVVVLRDEASFNVSPPTSIHIVLPRAPR